MTADRPDDRAATERQALARLYDLDVSEEAGDLDLYLALARRTAGVGPVVELATGTGRIAIPLAEAGHRVVGVDRDPAMLARARSRAAASATAGTADRLRWLEADLVDVDRPASDVRAEAAVPGGTFGLAILGLGSILLLERPDQRAAIRTMARLLAPGGVAALDAWLVPADELETFDGSVSLEWIRTEPDTGAAVTKWAAGRYDPGERRITLTTIFDEGRPGEPVARWTRSDELHLVETDDLVRLVVDAGLEVEAIGGDPELGPPGADPDRVVIVARRP